jgi:hypothetical protein
LAPEEPDVGSIKEFEVQGSRLAPEEPDIGRKIGKIKKRSGGA